MSLKNPDFLIIGGGVIGLNLALGIKRRWPDQSITLIEKEPSCGLHASTRNSGVLHAGFYYTTDSLKARFTRGSCKSLTEYCLEKGLNINRCGKLVVAMDESKIEGLIEFEIQFLRRHLIKKFLNLLIDKGHQSLSKPFHSKLFGIFPTISRGYSV